MRTKIGTLTSSNSVILSLWLKVWCAKTAFSVCCWTGDSWGQRFIFPFGSFLLLLAGFQRLKEDAEAQRHLASEAQAALPTTSWTVAARREKQGAHCELNTNWGGGVQDTPLVGVSPQRSSLWREEGEKVDEDYKFSQNKTMLINNTAPASVGGAK